jgi:hypothetical protein
VKGEQQINLEHHMITFNRALLTLVLGFMLLGCHQKWTGMNAAKLKEIVATELHPGDSAEKIKQFYSEQNIQYLYDKDLRRYEAFYQLPRAELERGHTLQVHIYVDQEGSFLRADIADSYTGL